MSDLSQAKTVSLKSRVSPAECAMRLDVAACYRLVALFGMNDLVYNHISGRVPGEDGHFLINPYGYAYEESTASSLVKIDLNGKLVLDSGTGHGVNLAGFVTMHWLERACQAQFAAMACNTELNSPDPKTVALTNERYKPGQRRNITELEWPAMLRMLERRDRSFRE